MTSKHDYAKHDYCCNGMYNLLCVACANNNELAFVEFNWAWLLLPSFQTISHFSFSRYITFNNIHLDIVYL
jgi:hypothetical protein